MGQCWRCGGEMGAYASRCNWCGRSSGVSTFFQVVTLAGLIGAAVMVGGVVPMSSISDVLPRSWRSNDAVLSQPVQTAAVSPAPGTRAGGGRSPGGYGAPAPAGTRESERRRRSSTEPERARRDSSCASGPAVSALALRYRAWSRDDLELIACRQIRTGFTTEQLVAARGRPRRTIESGDGSGTAVWVYRDRRVVVERGRVVVTGDR